MARKARQMGRDRLELEVLQRVALSLASSLSFEEVLNALARELVYAIERAGECNISLWDAKGDRLIDSAAWAEHGPLEWGPSVPTEYPLSKFPETRKLLEAGRGCIEYRLTDPQLRPEDRDVLEAYSWRAAIELPLVVEGRSVGLIEVADERSACRWSRRDIAFCQIIAAQAALAVRNAQLYEDLRQRVDRDSLTGLLNHRAFYERLRQELARAQRSGYRLAVMMLDLDDFKALNDTRGHLVGDDALRATAEVLEAACRTDDVAGRIGGDEFGVILLAVGEDVEMIARRVLKAIEAGGLVTASLGIAMAGAGELEPVRVMGQADLALREAKSAGKHTVRLPA